MKRLVHGTATALVLALALVVAAPVMMDGVRDALCAAAEVMFGKDSVEYVALGCASGYAHAGARVRGDLQ